MWNPRRTLQIPTKILFIAPKDSFCLPVNWSNKSNEEWRILSFMYVGSFNCVLKWSNSYLFGSGKCSHWSFIAWITIFSCFTQAMYFTNGRKLMIRFSSQIFNIIGIVVNEENEESAMKCRVLFSLFQVKTVVKRLLFFIGLSRYFRFVKAFLVGKYTF